MLIFVIPALYPYDDKPRLGAYVFDQIEALHKFSNHEFVILNAVQREFKSWKKCNVYTKSTSEIGDVYTKLTRGAMLSRFPHINQKRYLNNVQELFDIAVSEHGLPDRLYAHFSFPSGYAAYVLSKKHGIPFIVDEHYSLYLNRTIKPYIKKITIETINGSSNFICVSEKLRDSIQQHTGIDTGIKIIPNMISDIYKYYPKKERDAFVFFSAGNLFKSKNFDELVEAFVKAFGPDDNVFLRIAGEGPQYYHLCQLIAQHNRSNQISLLGKLNAKDMLEQYKECDCFALLSQYETFGIVYREALAVGRPIISYRNGGIEEDWSNDYGMLIDNGDFSSAASSLKKMKRNIEAYDPKTISSRCLSHYSSRIISEKLLDCIENISGKGEL